MQVILFENEHYLIFSDTLHNKIYHLSSILSKSKVIDPFSLNVSVLPICS